MKIKNVLDEKKQEKEWFNLNLDAKVHREKGCLPKRKGNKRAKTYS